MTGSPTFSIATVGCNFACACAWLLLQLSPPVGEVFHLTLSSVCQNWDLSQCTKDLKRQLTQQGSPEMVDVEIGKLGYQLPPAEVVRRAVANGCKIVAYTYSEPTIFFEYAIDTAKLAHEAGLMNVFKSNGFESAHTVDRMVGLIDAANIDLKSFNDAWYRRVCKGRLEPVLATIRKLHEVGIWTEVTTLVIPGENDSDDELTAIAQFLASVSLDIPWHVTPFHPDYQWADGSRQRTPDSTLDRAYHIGKRAGLRFVYGRAGNECTFCPNPACGAKLIQRAGIFGAKTVRENFADGKCLRCGQPVPGVWKWPSSK